MRASIYIFFLAILGQALSAESVFRENESAVEKDARMEWWRDAKFGMFVHWGLYAAAEGQWDEVAYPNMRPGIEWLMCKGGSGPGGGGIPVDAYVDALAPKMTLDQFDPEEWAALAEQAGMEYFVITAKHHDGFGMVDFPNTDYDIAGQTPYRADPMLPLSSAIREAGLKFGFYFSQSQDWSQPGGRPKWFKGLEGDWTTYAKNTAASQLGHLLGGEYGSIDLLWFDSGSMSLSKEGAAAIWSELAAQPGLIVNNRLKQGFAGDFDTPEQWIPAVIEDETDWETCMTMNGSWGYNPTDPHWKSADELIQKLCAVVGRGGNFLLNVGPRADGSWEPQVAEILREIGAWMEVNSEAIYGTEANPLGAQRWGEITWKTDGDATYLYVHILEWPANGELLLPLKHDPIALEWLGASSSEVSATRNADGLRLQLNQVTPLHPAVSVLRMELAEAPQALPLVIQANADGCFDFLAGEAAGAGEVRMHWRAPMLWGWAGKRADEAGASWTLRVPESGAYNVEIDYAYNYPEPDITNGQAFVVSIDGKTAHLPLTLTGTQPNSHNVERNELAVKSHRVEKPLLLSAGLHSLVVTAIGAPSEKRKFSRDEMRKGVYGDFAYIRSLRLVPVQ